MEKFYIRHKILYFNRIVLIIFFLFSGICTTKDIDIVLKHKNNARYLRDLDFARYYYYDRSGLYKAIAKRGGNIIHTACSIRYRREIPIFVPYKITTKVILFAF